MIISTWYHKARQEGTEAYNKGLLLTDNPYRKNPVYIKPDAAAVAKLADILLSSVQDNGDLVFDSEEHISKNVGQPMFWAHGWLLAFYVNQQNQRDE